MLRLRHLAAVRRLTTGQLASNAAAGGAAGRTMKQVEVDEPVVQKQLGRIQMDFVKKAEKKNAERATKHRQFRKGDWAIAGTCVAISVGIYTYTIYAIKQETFLDDFEMPDPLQEIERTK